MGSHDSLLPSERQPCRSASTWCDQKSRSDWTDEVGEAFGIIKATLEKQGRRIEDLDVAIAAHALARGATLVTANLDDMTRVPGLLVEDWASP